MKRSRRGFQFFTALGVALALTACGSKPSDKARPAGVDTDPYRVAIPASETATLRDLSQMPHGFFQLTEISYFHTDDEESLEFGYHHALSSPGQFNSAKDQWATRWFRGEQEQAPSTLGFEFPNALYFKPDNYEPELMQVTAYLSDYFYITAENEFVTGSSPGGSVMDFVFWDYAFDRYKTGRGIYSTEVGGYVYLIASEFHAGRVRVWAKISFGTQHRYLRLTYQKTSDELPF